MPRIPRDISGRKLAQLLEHYGYKIIRQTGSHVRLLADVHGLEHKITIPDHDYIKIGTLNSILNDLAEHLNMSKERLIEELFYHKK